MQGLRRRLADARRNQGGEVLAQSMHDPACDGDQTLVIYYVRAVGALEQMFADSRNAGNVTYFPQPEFDKNGDRVFSTLAGGLYWQHQQHRHGPGVVVVTAVVSTDEAKCTAATNMTCYAVYGEAQAPYSVLSTRRSMLVDMIMFQIM